MAEYENADTVMKLAASQITKMTNPQLKTALSTLLNAKRQEEPGNSILLEEIKYLREEIRELKQVKKEVELLTTRLNDAYTIIHGQQLFLESMDNRDRRQNIVVLGVKEEADEMGTSDDEKVKTILDTAGYTENLDMTEWEVKRLGKENEEKKRPILLRVNNQRQRDNILRVAKNLKEAGSTMARIYLKKDTHPAIRKEQARLRMREKEEKEKPCNAASNISYDWKNRVLLRDGVVIDRFSPKFF